MAIAQHTIFADLLRRHRRMAGLTQEELAERAGISMQAVSALERGINHTPRKDTVELLADALALSPEERAVFSSAARRHRLRGTTQPAPEATTERAGASVGDVDGDVCDHGRAASPSKPSPSEQRLPVGGFLGAVPESRIVARETEVARLVGALEAVLGGAGRCVVLAGEAGIGKTRLAQEAMLQARGRNVVVISGRCYEPQRAVPYYPFLEALTRAYATAPAALRADVPHRWAEVARLLPEQSDLEASTPVSRSSRGGHDEQQRLFWQVTSFLQALATIRPVALMLDDLHWADGASLALLQHLACHTREHRILLLGTYREGGMGHEHPLETVLRDLTRERLIERMRVHRLSEQGTQALIAGAMGEEQVPLEFAQLLYGRTGGNPFFTHEVLRALIDRGDVYRRAGRWDRRAIAEIAVPESVRSVIGQRLMLLASATQEVLREASVLGQVFAFEDLQVMSGRDEDALETALDEAAVAGLLRETDLDRYAFNHVLTQQALYAELPTRKKRRLHLAAAEAIERSSERERSQRAAELAWHFMEAKAGGRALPYAITAGDHASRVYAHAGAERYYQIAADLARDVADPAREADALERLGTVLRVVGRHDEALECLDSAATTYRRLKDLAGLASATTQIGWLYNACGAPEEGLARLQPVVELVDESGIADQCASIYAALAELYFTTGRYERFLHTADRLAECARTSDDAMLRGMAEQLRGRALLLLGDVQAGSEVIEDAIQDSQAHDDMGNLCVSLTMASLVLRLQGRSAEDTQYAERACLVASRFGNPLFIALAGCNRAIALWHVGDWQRAWREMERAYTAVEHLGNAFVVPYVDAARGILCFTRGDQAAGRAHLEQAVALAERTGDLLLLRLAQAPLAEWELLEGRASAARARLLPLLDAADQQETFVAPLLPLVAWAEMGLGHDEQAAAWLDQSVALAQERQFRLVLLDAARVRASLAIKHERWAEAEDALAEALTLAQASSYPHGEIKAFYVYGQLYAAQRQSEQASEKYQAALAICERLGEGLYRPHIERALAGADARR
jgi:transcriptional regulator with XRE-family HTH domain/tetratricopeptide (TPR) repeat protein